MKRDATILAATGLLGGALASLVGYHVGTARATIPPVAQRLFYGGQLSGVAAGTHAVRVEFFNASTAGASICGPVSDASMPNGSFQINVSTCEAAFKANGDVFAQLTVDSTVLVPPAGVQRPRVGAVPYAIQAEGITGGVASAQVMGAIPATQVSSGSTTVQQRLDALETNVPPGTIVAYAGTDSPIGYLLCDGAALPRATYAALFSKIGETYGAGNGTTTFNVPNAKGVFLRGEGSQVISGDTYSAAAKGGLQGDMFRAHNHGGGNHGHSMGAIDISGGGYNPNGAYLGKPGANNAGFLNGSGNIISVEGGPETRPANLVVTYYIKA